MSDGAIATGFAMAGLAAGAAFFAVWALAAPVEMAMADITAMSVVLTVDICVSLLNENEMDAADYTGDESIPASLPFECAVDAIRR